MSDLISCGSCGRSVSRDDSFCPGCGSAVTGTGETLTDQDAATVTMSTQCGNCSAPMQRDAQFCAKCGTPRLEEATVVSHVSLRNAQAAHLIDLTKGEYEIKQQLGHGAMGSVYLAKDLALGRMVAIKVIAANLLQDEAMLSRFTLEAQTVASLRHPNIVDVYAVKRADDLHYFVMDFIDGPNLRSLIKSHAPLEIKVVQGIMYQIGSALSYAHRTGSGVIHRDIKPANIMLDNEGESFVTDFGISKVAEQSTGLTQTGATIGTPEYMSPEQCRGEDLTGASDQYALGIVAYEMLTGRTPFSGTHYNIMIAHTQEEPTPILDARPDCPTPVAEAVERMLAKEPADRWPDLDAAASAMGGIHLGYQHPTRARICALVGATQGELDALGPPTGPGTGAETATSLTITGLPKRVEPGDTFNLTADVRGEGETSLTGLGIQWRSEDSKIAKVDGGVVEAVSGGSVAIEARVGSVMGSVLVEVEDVAPVAADPGATVVAPAAVIEEVKEADTEEAPVEEAPAERKPEPIAEQPEPEAPKAAAPPEPKVEEPRVEEPKAAAPPKPKAEEPKPAPKAKPAEPPKPKIKTAEPKKKKSPVPLVVAAVVIIGGGVGAFVMSQGGDETTPPAGSQPTAAQPTNESPPETPPGTELAGGPGATTGGTPAGREEPAGGSTEVPVETGGNEPPAGTPAETVQQAPAESTPTPTQTTQQPPPAETQPQTQPTPAAAPPERATGITVNVPSQVGIGETLPSSASVQSNRGGTMAGATVTWRANGPSVTVASDGSISGFAPGSSYIVASAEGFADSVLVRTTYTVDVTVGPTTLEVGESGTATATTSGVSIPALIALDWQTSDPSVATVDADGTVRAIGAGTADIILDVAGVTGQASIVVEAGGPTEPSMNDIRPELDRYISLLVAGDSDAVLGLWGSGGDADRREDLEDFLGQRDLEAEIEQIGSVQHDGGSEASVTFEVSGGYRSNFGGRGQDFTFVARFAWTGTAWRLANVQATESD